MKRLALLFIRRITLPTFSQIADSALDVFSHHTCAPLVGFPTAGPGRAPGAPHCKHSVQRRSRTIWPPQRQQGRPAGT